MTKLWIGRTSGLTDRKADDFNSSVRFDSRMYREDIEGSAAHAEMLAKQGIIPADAAEQIIAGLHSILKDLDEGVLEIDPEAEDIHMFVESVLTERIGEAGRMLHTARSRNDQVANDLRMYLKKEIRSLTGLTVKLIEVLNEQAEKYTGAVMPGYTHLQRAQPVFFSQHLLAYEMMFLRDLSRLKDTYVRTDESVIGTCALAGTTYPTDRKFEADLLGFSSVSLNSMDSVSDRDFCIELLGDLSILMMHLSRLSEEILLWTSWEFRFIELSDAFTTGSSIMPQKKNSDMAELVRGKTGRVYGDLMSLLTVMKGLPLAYNKDMQEDKEPVFDAVDTAKMCLDITAEMIGSMTVHADRMKQAAQEGYLNATDLADYLCTKGMPFRSAYQLSGRIVRDCMEKGIPLEAVPLADYRSYDPSFDEDIYEAIDLVNCADRRNSFGGTSKESAGMQIRAVKEKLNEFRNRDER
ncbi:MAG: argininosuccinate lyase [Solobacterium sp.]|nr:argininosuccinate lyase [Solobacterium sp.]